MSDANTMGAAMVGIAGARRRAATFGVLGAALLPCVCRAEAYGPADPQLMLIVGAVLGAPSALLCVLAEAIRPRRHLPANATIASAAGFVLATALALFATRPDAIDTRPLFLAWASVPVLAVLALRGAVAVAWIRLAAGWLLVLTVLGLVRLRHPGPPDWAFLLGGAATCAALWTVTLLAMHLSGAAPDRVASVDFRARLVPIRAALGARSAAAVAEARAGYGRLTPARSGLLWWLGSAAALYFGIGGLMTAGLVGQTWFDVELMSWIEFIGWRAPRVAKPIEVWWWYGLPWSLLVGGAVWGFAATWGLLDAGRARPARLAALLLGIALVGWSIVISVNLAAVSAAEERASGLRR